MSDPQFQSLMTFLAACVSAIVAVFNTYVSHQREQKNKETRETVRKLEANTDGIASDLAKANERLNTAEFNRGVQQGQEHPR